MFEENARRAADLVDKPTCGMTFLHGDRIGPSARGRAGPVSPAGARFCMGGRVSQLSLRWPRRARHTSATSAWNRGSATSPSGPMAVRATGTRRQAVSMTVAGRWSGT